MVMPRERNRMVRLISIAATPTPSMDDDLVGRGDPGSAGEAFKV